MTISTLRQFPVGKQIIKIENSIIRSENIISANTFNYMVHAILRASDEDPDLDPNTRFFLAFAHHSQSHCLHYIFWNLNCSL